MPEMNHFDVAYDCKYFLGDRPCKWHKINKVLCKCDHYTKIRENILIIKLDAMGDVLRTTCLLPVIARHRPEAGITWITRNESIPLLYNNPYINEVINYDTDAMVHLTSRKFDNVINLDAGKVSASMATMANAKEKTGYILHENGHVVATNSEAEMWLRTGISDDIKKNNKRTYQEIMCAIIGFESEGLKYVLSLTDKEKEIGRLHLKRLGVDLDKKVIGIHTGGGGRWRMKQWGENSFIKLIESLQMDTGNEMQICLFGGPMEKEQNQRIQSKINGRLFDTGSENSIRHVAALIANCSVILSGDSLAMHLALAMERRVVILFGPTSHTEIELFGLGEKIIPDMDCLVCYKQECTFSPNCMDSIAVDQVQQAILRQL